MAIVFVGSSFGFGSGAIKRAAALSSSKLNVHVIYFYSLSYISRRLKGADLNDVRKNYESELNFLKSQISGKVYFVNSRGFFDIYALLRLFSILRIVKPSSIFCHHSFVSQISILISWILKIPNRFVVEMSDLSRKSLPLKALSLISYFLAKNVIFISNSCRESGGFLEKFLSRDKYKIIYNGVDLSIDKTIHKRYFLELSTRFNIEKYRYIFYAGRLHPIKNLSLLIKAYSHFKTLFVRDDVLPKLVIAGAGPDKPMLQSLCLELGLNDDVLFVGHLSNDYVNTLTKFSSVFTMCSISEGFSESIVKSMALARPIVTTHNASFAEALADGAGLIVDPDPMSYGKALFDVYSNVQIQKQLADKALERVKKFSMDSVARSYIELIHSGA